MELVKEYIILAQGVTVDEQDKSLSIFKLIDNSLTMKITEEQFNALPRTPEGRVVLPLGYFIVSSWKIEGNLKVDTPIEIRVKFLDPKGKEMFSNSQTQTIPVGSKRVRFNIGMQGQGYTEAGDYTYKLEVLDSNKSVAKGEYTIATDIQVEK